MRSKSNQLFEDDVHRPDTQITSTMRVVALALLLGCALAHPHPHVHREQLLAQQRGWGARLHGARLLGETGKVTCAAAVMRTAMVIASPGSAVFNVSRALATRPPAAAATAPPFGSH